MGTTLCSLMRWRKNPRENTEGQGREQRREEGQGVFRGKRRGKEHSETPLYLSMEDPLSVPWNMILSLLGCL